MARGHYLVANLFAAHLLATAAAITGHAALRVGSLPAAAGNAGESVSLAVKTPPTGALLAVTGYWKVSGKHSPAAYLRGMKWVMTLNTPMVVYGDAFGLKHMVEARGNATQALVAAQEVSVEDLPLCAHHAVELKANTTKWTLPPHVPSVLVGCIWDGKVSLLAQAARDFPGYQFYAWVDIGMHAQAPYSGIFRNHRQQPWPHPSKLAQLPSDKISISHTGLNCAQRCNGWSDNPLRHLCHCAAATSFVIPRAIVFDVERSFGAQVESCLDFFRTRELGYACLSEQVVFTQVANDRPDFFHWVGHGYGAAAANLTTGDTLKLAHSNGPSDLLSWLTSSQEEDSRHSLAARIRHSRI